ncbi:flagellin [Azotosporobacter soli]|uniref:flagellin N-terminal helical domain-containing protein n=1 Tax=Azotosporobacter soli TaxID=3055040 RepID=UPI0031FE4E26
MQIGAYTPSYSNYSNALQNQQKAMLRMATGERINKAADDVAALAISEKLRGQISGSNQAERNAQDSISMLNVAEGGMNSSADTMQRMRELSVQAGNGTLTDQDRSMIQQEMNQLGAQLNSNASNTQFNGINTNDGTLSNMTSQVGANAGQTATASIGNTSAAGLGVSFDVSTQAAAATTLDSIDTGMANLSSIRSSVGASVNGLQYSSDIASSSAENLQAAESRYRDADMAKEATLFGASGIGLYANIMALSKTMQQQQGMLSLLA